MLHILNIVMEASIYRTVPQGNETNIIQTAFHPHFSPSPPQTHTPVNEFAFPYMRYIYNRRTVCILQRNQPLEKEYMTSFRMPLGNQGILLGYTFPSPPPIPNLSPSPHSTHPVPRQPPGGAVPAVSPPPGTAAPRRKIVSRIERSVPG